MARDRRPLYITIAEEILSDFSGWRGEAERRLPREMALAERYQVSRATVREALRLLERDGAVRSKHGIGTFMVSETENVAPVPEEPTRPGTVSGGPAAAAGADAKAPAMPLSRPEANALTFVSTRVYAGQGQPFAGYVCITGGKIAAVGPGAPPEEAGRVIDAGGSRLIPGLIDLHIHGSAGTTVGDGDLDSLVRMARFLADNGVTAFQPTAEAIPVPALENAIADVKELTRGLVRGARSIGLHMEGPFLNPERSGAMPKGLLMKPDSELMARWCDLGGGTVNHVTVAPELPGALPLIEFLVSHGVTASAGHTSATYDQMLAGFRAGVTVGNHTYNAMRELRHREPGALGALLTQPGIYCEIIADCVHVHPAAMRLLIQAKGPDYVCLVTDAVAAAGMPPGEYSFLGRKVTVDESGACRLPDGTLAGSTARLRECLRNVVEVVGVPFDVALGMATVNPAKAARVFHRKGSLAPGKDADLVVLGDRYEVLWSVVEGEIQKSGE